MRRRFSRHEEEDDAFLFVLLELVPPLLGELLDIVRFRRDCAEADAASIISTSPDPGCEAFRFAISK